MGAQSTWDGLPPLAKTVISILGAVSALGLGYFIYYKVTERVKLASKFKEKKEVDKELLALKAKGIKPTWSQASYIASADRLFTAMDGYTTDEEAIYREFEKMKNDADILSIISAYGVRELSTGDYNPDKNKKQTLGESITDELGTDAFGRDEVKKLNKILTNNKITILF